MNISIAPINGWLRLLILLSLIWLGCVCFATSAEVLFPRLHSWLFLVEVGSKDPLGLFPTLDWSKFVLFAGSPLVLLWGFGLLVAWVYRGFSGQEPSPLLVEGRLQDVLALIQVLSLDTKSHRSDAGLSTELQGNPRSAKSWAEVARSHPEFFRYQSGLKYGVSLVARHVLPENEEGVCELPVDFAGKLLGLAVDLHDRQLRRARAWEVFIPVFMATLAGVVSLIGIAIKP